MLAAELPNARNALVEGGHLVNPADPAVILTVPDDTGIGLPVIASTITINNASISRASAAPSFRIFGVRFGGSSTP